MTVPVRLLMCWSLSALFGCGGAGPHAKSLTDSDPASKIPAIKQKVRQKDLESVGQLVKDLESDDPAVRFYAIEGLRRLTGETYEYRYYESEDQRKLAVEKWKRWMSPKSSEADSAKH